MHISCVYYIIFIYIYNTFSGITDILYIGYILITLKVKRAMCVCVCVWGVDD